MTYQGCNWTSNLMLCTYILRTISQTTQPPVLNTALQSCILRSLILLFLLLIFLLSAGQLFHIV